MKPFYLLVLLHVFAIGLVCAQTKPLSRANLDRLNTRTDSLEEKIIQRVEKAHGAGAGVGTDGPWALEQKALQKSATCIQQATATQAGVIIGCLEPLRIRYENERAERIYSVTRLAHTLATPLFVTKDGKLIEVVDFLDKNLTRIETDKNLSDELARTLRWEETPQELDRLTHQFVQQMRRWKKHLEQDKTSSD